MSLSLLISLVVHPISFVPCPDCDEFQYVVAVIVVLMLSLLLARTSSIVVVRVLVSLLSFLYYRCCLDRLFCLRSCCVSVFGFVDRLQCLWLPYVIIVVVIALFSSTLFESFFRRAFVCMSSLVCR